MIANLSKDFEPKHEVIKQLNWMFQENKIPEYELPLATLKQIDLIFKICKWKKLNPPPKIFYNTLTMDEACSWIDNSFQKQRKIYKWKSRTLPRLPWLWTKMKESANKIIGSTLASAEAIFAQSRKPTSRRDQS